MPTTPPMRPATDPIAAAGADARLADAAGPASVAALVPPPVCAAANVAVPPVATVLEAPPVGAAADRAKIVGEARFGLGDETAAGPDDGAAPRTTAVTTGVDAPLALEVPPAGAAGRPLTGA